MSSKKYKCKYCSFVGTKEELVSHTEEVHPDMIPKNYTAARLVFNNIHKKDHGTCVVCKRETPWNEKNWKYSRLCGRKSCKEALRKNYEKNMVRVYKTTNLLTDVERQEMMLAHRSISGSYKFKDGGIRTYTGSYERKTLEFFDKVLNVPSDDIMTPGPVLEYQFEGKTLRWITDILYIPANLIIEVKDGGSNPNTRRMDSYRAKQEAKEQMITELGTYNYLRLTDNNFEQLLLVLAELKQQMIDDAEENKKAIISINEEVGGIPASTPFSDPDSIYVVPYGYNNVFSDDVEGYGFTTSLDSDKIMIVDENQLISTVPRSFLDNRKYTVYRCSTNKFGKKFININEAYKNKQKVSRYYFYELLSGKESYTENQIESDKDFKEANDYIAMISEIRTHSLISEVHKTIDKSYYINILSPTLNKQITEKLKGYKNISIFEDVDGFFAINEVTHNRTRSYDNIKEISDGIIYLLNILK